MKQEGVADFRSAWEEMDEGTELADSYGLGQRDSMQEAVEAVIAILGMQVAAFACLQLLHFLGSTYALYSHTVTGVQSKHVHAALAGVQQAVLGLYMLWCILCYETMTLAGGCMPHITSNGIVDVFMSIRAGDIQHAAGV